MESEPGLDTQPSPEPAPATRYYVPAASCGGMIAAVVVLFVSGAGLLSTLPGSPAAGQYPVWLTWVLRLAPLPALLLLWAVAAESEFKVKTDATAMYLRRGLGQTLRIPWRDVVDYYANCGRSLAAVCEAGASLAQDPTADRSIPPLASHRPEYTVVCAGGTHVFDDGLQKVGQLTADIAARAPERPLSLWEEASLVACKACSGRFAVTLRVPIANAEARLPEPSPFTCPLCEADLSELLAGCGQAAIVDIRGANRTQFLWRPMTQAEPPVEAPQAAAPEEAEPDGPQAGPESG